VISGRDQIYPLFSIYLGCLNETTILFRPGPVHYEGLVVIFKDIYMIPLRFSISTGGILLTLSAVDFAKGGKGSRSKDISER
jgi:hypothetical protein